MGVPCFLVAERSPPTSSTGRCSPAGRPGRRRGWPTSNALETARRAFVDPATETAWDISSGPLQYRARPRRSSARMTEFQEQGLVAGWGDDHAVDRLPHQGDQLCGVLGWAHDGRLGEGAGALE